MFALPHLLHVEVGQLELRQIQDDPPVFLKAQPLISVSDKPKQRHRGRIARLPSVVVVGS